MKVGSLFSGVGLMDLGLQQAGHEVRWIGERIALADERWRGR